MKYLYVFIYAILKYNSYNYFIRSINYLIMVVHEVQICELEGYSFMKIIIIEAILHNYGNFYNMRII